MGPKGNTRIEKIHPERADQLSAAITGAERLAEASREYPLDGDLEDALQTVRTAARLLQQAQDAVLGVFPADTPPRDPGDIAVENIPGVTPLEPIPFLTANTGPSGATGRPLAEWTQQELLHAEDPAPELSVEAWRRMTDSEFQRYAAAEIRKAVPPGRAAMGPTS